MLSLLYEIEYENDEIMTFAPYHWDWEPGNWEGIFQSGKRKGILNRLENHTKYWESQEISDKCCLLFFSDI